MTLFRRILAWAAGGLLLVAGLLKAGDPAPFAETIARYRVFPAALNQTAAVVLPWWEIAAGLLLVGGLWVRPAAWIGMLLFASFLGMGLQALLRGLDVRCGCFGFEAALGWPMLLLDAAGIGACLALSTAPRRPPTPSQPPR